MSANDGKISNMTNMSGSASVDRSADFLEISDSSGPTTYKATPNFILGITGNPVGHTDTQTLSNKTLGNTNTVTLKGTLFTLQDDSDTTKQARFVMSGITTGTTRSYTLPNASGTLVDLASSQTLTNKTLTSPVISGGSIDNSTVTIDALTGHTSANTGTVYGISISSAVFTTNNIVPNNSLSNTGAFSSNWSWITWSPALTNLSGGTQSYAKYTQIGKKVSFRFKYTLAGAGISGSVSFTLPVTAHADYVSEDQPVNTTVFYDAGNNDYLGGLRFATATTVNLIVTNATGTYGTLATPLSSTVPFTWGSGDYITANGEYEAA